MADNHVSTFGNADPERFVRRLEALARQLKSGAWRSGEDIWAWQLSLLDLQRAIQAEITTLKIGRRTAEQQTRLDGLKDARWQARRLGDAFAWVVLGVDMPVLHSLAENERVPVSVDDHGSTGMTAIAMHLANEGWGFPVIHDVTDCLRIGDITFVDMTTKPRTFRTVEVKTRITGERPAGDGKAVYTYQVHVIHPADPDKSVPHVGATLPPEELSVKPTGTEPHAPRWTPRAERQMRRMERALAKQHAVPGTITHIPGDDDPLLTMQLETKIDTHWRELRRLIRSARRNGYASEVIDGAMLYLAFYREEGLSQESVRDSRVAEDLKRSGILDRINDSFPNSLVIHEVPPQNDRGGLRYLLPHFLYEVPHRAITDLLHRRLAIVVLSNPARFADALEGVGLEVSNRSGIPNLEPGSIVVTHRFRDGSGREWQAELHNLHWHIFELIYEFKSVQHLVATALRMRDVAQEAFVARNAIEMSDPPSPGSRQMRRPATDRT
jgi:hypothetical protein